MRNYIIFYEVTTFVVLHVPYYFNCIWLLFICINFFCSCKMKFSKYKIVSMFYM